MCFAAFADTMGLFAKPLVLSPWRYLSVVARVSNVNRDLGGTG